MWAGASKGATPWAPPGGQKRPRLLGPGGTWPRSRLPVGRSSGCRLGLAAAPTVLGIGSLPAFGFRRPSCCEHGANQVLLSLFLLDSFLGIHPRERRTAGRRVLRARLSLCCLGSSQLTAAQKQGLAPPSQSRAPALRFRANAPGSRQAPRASVSSTHPEEPRESQPLGSSRHCPSGRGDSGHDGGGALHTPVWRLRTLRDLRACDDLGRGLCPQRERREQIVGRSESEPHLRLGLDNAWARTPSLGNARHRDPWASVGFFITLTFA